MRKLISALMSLVLIFLCACQTEVSEAADGASKAADPEKKNIIISELMIKNRCTLRDEDGLFSDWIELFNPSGLSLSTEGCTLSDGNGEWKLPELYMEPGERKIIFASGKDKSAGELHCDFRLSNGENLTLRDGQGNICSELICDDTPPDCSLILKDGQYALSLYPTPGRENSAEGYESAQESINNEGPLIINEVMTANKERLFPQIPGDADWVELKNISNEKILLSDYFLSNDYKKPELYQLPKHELSPDRSILILCTEAAPEGSISAGFSLSSENAQLYLSCRDGLKDWVSLKNIPANCSYGRRDGENGFFYFDRPSPGSDNRGGERRISTAPVSLTPEGVYNDTDSLSVALSGRGRIYYTLDGSLPTEDSEEYKEPLTLDKTTVLRAVAVQQGALPSRSLTLSFIMNENHTLPVLSLVSDNPSKMRYMYSYGSKSCELPGGITYFGDDGSFNLGCGISFTGHDSLSLPKKSIAVSFRGCYGEKELQYDLFGTGHTDFSALAIRAGQDNHRLIFRQELWQDLCLEMTDNVPNQHSKFCILYINGEYYGIHCLKERINSGWYAGLKGCGKNQVESVYLNGMKNLNFQQEVFDFCRKTDLSQEENYIALCGKMDMDSFIDWFIVQGVSGNMDLFQNVRFMRCEGGKWQPVLFDLDHSMMNDFLEVDRLKKFRPAEHQQFGAFFGNSCWSSSATTRLLRALLKSESFRDSLLSRYGQVYSTYLSNESILERIDYYEQLLSPEVERDWLRWQEKPELWREYVEDTRTLVTDSDWENAARESLFFYLSDAADISREEFDSYFN